LRAICDGTLTNGSHLVDTAYILVGKKPGANTASRLRLFLKHTYAALTVPCSVMVWVQNDEPWQTVSRIVQTPRSGSRFIGESLFVWAPGVRDYGPTSANEEGSAVLTLLGKDIFAGNGLQRLWLTSSDFRLRAEVLFEWSKRQIRSLLSSPGCAAGS
jgi:hypothetical protein